jgi:hypothetical protein
LLWRCDNCEVSALRAVNSPGFHAGQATATIKESKELKGDPSIKDFICSEGMAKVSEEE